MTKCICVEIPQTVRVRKYEIDQVALAVLLREKRKQAGLGMSAIADSLEIPQTQVEHYFRTDKYGAVPEPEIWPKLSRLLGVSDTELDKQITEFETRDGVFEKSNRCYWWGGLSPTITTSDDIKIITEV